MLGIIGVVVDTTVVGVDLGGDTEALDILTPKRENAVGILRRSEA